MLSTNGTTSSHIYPVILAVDRHPELRKALQRHYQVLAPDQDCSTARVIVTLASAGADNELLERFPNLELVAVFGVGLDGIDLEYCRGRGLMVANTPGVLDDAVAELALALLLAVSRRVCEADHFVRDGEWHRTVFPLSLGLSGRVCGVVGLGRIGKRIAQLAEALKMRVIYHGRQEQSDVSYDYFDDLWALANEADVLMLALPGGPETEGLIDSTILQALGPQGVLINVARGSVIDQEALLEALEYGDLGGAGLDVFWSEPEVPEVLLRLPNVVLTPHLGSATESTRLEMLEFTLKNIASHFLGESVPGLVNF